MKFSIITPIYKTPEYKIDRLYKSLINQTYSDWEWIVFDDSPTDYKDSYNYIDNLAKNDNRIKLYSDNKNCGIIGEVKRKAFYLGTGDILVEVDHDDELINSCLENLKTAYKYSDDIGFVFGFCCEIYEDEEDILDYGDFWAFGYGGYSNTIYNNKNYKVATIGNINPKTIRHIVSIPNHVRSWRKEVYYKIGGHNKHLEVADDYEIFVRTFLNTKIAKVEAFTYIQYFEREKINTQFIKNKDIQILVDITAKYYNNKIHNRFLELDITDYVWIDHQTYDLNLNSNIEEYANIVIPNNLLKNPVYVSKQNDIIDIYGYSRHYDIPSTIKYKQTESYTKLLTWIIKLTNCQSYLEFIQTTEQNYISEIINYVKNYKIVNDNITNKEFFETNNEKFDIIFLDKNHNFEQAKLDFDNSLNILNEYGIILIHDTDPITKELTESIHCDNCFELVNYIENIAELNIITLPLQETGLSIVMRKNDKRINNIK
ncbi:glycosyltransferase [Candidatus Dojkabacteria bacterium]|jgi:glycosyltransferase involved in cell wall biosynthesis|nr:glycosyltransferase [Candidatus Dojkabacteria bacterium]